MSGKSSSTTPATPVLSPALSPALNGVSPTGAKTLDQILAGLSAPDRFLTLFHKELDDVGRLDHLLSRVEEILLDPKHLQMITDDALLLDIYNAVNSRRGNSQRFILRAFELGIRTSLLSRLVTPEKPVGAASMVVPLTDKQLQVKQILQKAVDQQSNVTSPPEPAPIDSGSL